MSCSSDKVGEIFTSAGQAFNTLGQLTRELRSPAPAPGSGPASAKWTEEEISMLHNAVANFAKELETISERIKGRNLGQIKSALKKKAFEDAGISIEAAAEQTANAAADSRRKSASASESESINVLNSSTGGGDSEVDVEGLGGGGGGSGL